MKKFILLIILITTISKAICQHESIDNNPPEHEAPFHKLSLVMANSLINNTVGDNSNTILIVPTFGFNYDYYFHNKWALGLHNDLLLQQYKVERHHDNEELVRENPVAICGIISFKFHPRWALMSGYGVELEKHENISLFRIGLEYGIALRNNWELGFGIEYDYKIKAYSSMMIGAVFSKLLFKKHD